MVHPRWGLFNIYPDGWRGNAKIARGGTPGKRFSKTSNPDLVEGLTFLNNEQQTFEQSKLVNLSTTLKVGK